MFQIFNRFKNFQSNLHRLSNIRIKKSAKKFNKRYKKYEVEFEEMIRPYIQELETSVKIIEI